MKSVTYNDDCKRVMKTFPDKIFDLAVVDPPYFSGPERIKYYGGALTSNGIKRKEYPVTSKWVIPDEEYFHELFRISKYQVIWGCNYFPYYFGSGRIIWDKVNQSSSFSDCEIAYCSLFDSTRLFRYMWNGALQGKSISEGHIMQGNKTKNEKRIHPTQKPVLLYKWTYSLFGEKVKSIIDTHLGSGSSRIAAYDMGIEFTGIEIEKIHFHNQEKRFSDYISQQVLPLI